MNLKKIIFDLRIYFDTVARACAYVICEGGSCEASLGTTRLRVYGGVDVRLCSFLLWELGIALQPGRSLHRSRRYPLVVAGSVGSSERDGEDDSCRREPNHGFPVSKW